MLSRLVHPPTLIYRPDHESTKVGWVGGMRADLAVVSERWVFHLTDDTSIPDPLPLQAIAALLAIARSQNASTVAVGSFLEGWWKLRGGLTQLPLSLEQQAALPGVVVWRASATQRTHFVVQQNVALWNKADLEWSLAPFRSRAAPSGWEMGWNNGRFLRSAIIARGLHAADADSIRGVSSAAQSPHHLTSSSLFCLPSGRCAAAALSPTPLGAST